MSTVASAPARKTAALFVRDRWPYLVAGLVPPLVLAPFLAGRAVLYFGTPLLQFYPWRVAALAALRAGEVPLWNPWVGNGAPLLANYQAGLLYPLNWLALLMPLDLSMGWLAALHLALAGLGMVALARRLALEPLGQVVAGLAFGLSQYLVARAGFLSINAAVAWLPWLVWAADWQLALPAGSPWHARLRPALALAVITALALLAGHAQTAWYGLLITAAWALWRLAGLKAGTGYAWKARAVAVGWLIGPLVLAAGLAAAQLLPTAELMRASPRAESADYAFVMTYSFSPWRLATLLAPDLLGNPARSRFYGYGNYWEDAVYAGVLPVLLAIGALTAALVQRLRGGRASGPAAGLPLLLGAISVVCVALALGQNTPLFPFFYRFIPTFNLFQAPARIMLGLAFSLALLAGLGADGWIAPRGRALYWTRLGTAGAAAVIGMGFGAAAYVSTALPARAALGAQLRVVATAVGLAGVGLLASGALSLLKDRLPARAWTALVVGFIAVDLLYASYGLNPPAPRALYTMPSSTGPALAPLLAGHRLFVYPVEEQVIKFKRLLSFETFGPPERALGTRAAQLPNTAGLDGLESANNFDPLVSARYAGVIEAAEATQSLALLRMMNVGVLASSAPRSLPVLAEAPEAGVRFYQVPGPAARAWVVHQARAAADGDAALALLGDRAFDPATTAVLEGDGVPADAGGRADAGPEPLALQSTFNTVTIQATLAVPGWVVLADTVYPGWEAWVDGEPTAILPANYAFRAVAVGPGAHTVEFVYRPWSFRVGALMSGASLVVMAAAVVWARTLSGPLPARRLFRGRLRSGQLRSD